MARACHVLGKHSTIEPHYGPSPLKTFLQSQVVPFGVTQNEPSALFSK